MIGPTTTIKGSVTGDEDLEVQGRIEGAVRLSRDLTVAESAVLIADVEAQAVELDGRIEGNVVAGKSLNVSAGAVLVGDITTPRLSIADGARFKGRVTMDFEIPGVDPKSKRR